MMTVWGYGEDEKCGAGLQQGQGRLFRGWLCQLCGGTHGNYQLGFAKKTVDLSALV
jgi:hypothetical protein